MEIFKPEVKSISIFKEIAKNIVNPLEILREALSNSYDAEARNISIIIYRNQLGKFIIEVQDDGKSMTLNEVHKFFNLGDSKKSNQGIGEKGLGTKIYFKSDKITVRTQTRENESYRVTMEKPWDSLCNNTLPEYKVETSDIQPGKAGTIVIIEGYIIDNPERYFNFDTIRDYISWFTAAGSFKTYFANFMELHKYIHNMQVAPRILLDDRILGKKEELVGIHQFYPPQEKPKEDPCELIYKKSVNYCRHFGPYHKATNINGEYVSFQIYGTVSGINCRRSIVKLRQGETLKSRFGIYLAKDFIPFTKTSILTSDHNYHHYHLLVNSQVFELTSDRNNISNQDDLKVKWVFEEAKKIINDDIITLAEEGYFNLRRVEESQYYINNKQSKLNERLEKFDKIDNLLVDEIPVIKRPDNESQVAILFSAIMSNRSTKKLVKNISKIGHYSNVSSTDMICLDNDNNKVLVEIEYKLSNLFMHDHPYETFDYVVCWKVDLQSNEKKCLRDGTTLSLLRTNGEWLLKYGTQKVIPIIVLNKIINEFKEHRNIVVDI